MSKTGRRFVGKRIADRYCITGKIGKGGMGVVYKAIPFDDPSHSVAIKVIERTGKLGYEDLMRFQKEASLMSQLHHTNIVVFHELGLFGGQGDDSDDIGQGYYIVMEIADGTNLKESLARDGRKDLPYFFQVGLQVTTALDYTHGKNIIHRDIKPHNIVVGRAWQDQKGVLVKVLDFGVARLAEAMHFTGERNKRGFEEAAGTPLYMAPEQTPLMDAPVDHRVDLYSLGCVLYEILAGKPPFTANSRERLEKQHVFAQPEHLRNLRPDVPPIVEKIVHKLLAKHPKERYQTAFALHADLLRAKYQYDKGGRNANSIFTLGLKDRFQAVSAQLPLSGRQDDLMAMIEGYDAVSKVKGRSRLTLLHGTAGVGKSRLMREFQTYLAQRNVRFVSGTFSQHENALPFNALANAFNEYLYRVMKSHPHEAEELKRRFKTTLGSVAFQIAAIVPGLRPFITDLEEDLLEEEEADLMNNRESFKKFAKAFSDFTRCLGTDNQPIVFLFDDLHWADAKSLDLIDQFFSNANTLQFYLVISQRSGIIHQNERFNNFVTKFRKLRRRYLDVEIKALSRNFTQRMLEDMLKSTESVYTDLGDYLFEQSNGNPMHLVELVRTLVARDLIYPRSSGQWAYKIERLNSAQVQIKTIDLVLNRIQDYEENHRQVLEIAATCGLTFQFEMLTLQDVGRGQSTLEAINKAMEEGLIVRVTDDEYLKHLGKSYMFSHKKARDDLYEGIEESRRKKLHRAIAMKLVKSIARPPDKILFALAHHFNAAMDQTAGEDLDLIQHALRFNIKAGKTARHNGSWQTAERYYENALRLMSEVTTTSFSNEEQIKVKEVLADLAAVQKHHGKALKSYRNLLREKLPLSNHAGIAYKAVFFQLVGGIVSDSVKLIDRTLVVLGRKTPKLTWQNSLGFWIGIGRDFLLGKRASGFQALKFAYKYKNIKNKNIESKVPALQFYRVGSLAHLSDNVPLAMIFHDHAITEARKGRGSPRGLIQTAVERAAVLGYLGSVRMSYAMFDKCLDVAKACGEPTVFGYAALLRVLTLDYIKSRHEEISYSLKVALEFIKPTEDRLAFGMGIVFKIFRELMRCNFNGVYNYSQMMPDTVPTRNALSPRYVSMMLFGYLLQGSRANIVRHGEMFLKRRQKVAARTNDLFIKIINTMINFSKGEIDTSRECYILAMRDFVYGSEREFLFPYEEDFVGLFALAFPLIFEQEYGRHLMRTKELNTLLKGLKQRVKYMRGKDRAVPLLLKARINELLGEKRNISSLYDSTLNSAKVSGNNLAQVFAYLWFGMHLMDQGYAKKKGYIQNAYLLAKKLRMKALIDYIQKMMEKRNVSVEKSSQVNSTLSKHISNNSMRLPSTLFVEHLHHVCQSSEADSALAECIAGSVDILGKNYKSERIYCILTPKDQENPIVIYPEIPVADAEQIVAYLEPYINIRSTLFLPLNDAPWVSTQDLESRTPTEGRRSSFQQGSTRKRGSSREHENPFLSDEATIVVEKNDLDQGTLVQGFESEPMPLETDRGTNASQIKSRGLKMSALIPLRSGFDGLGVVFLEDFDHRHKKDSTLIRHELDQFGSQMAMIVERKAAFDFSLTQTAPAANLSPVIYKPTSFTLEEVPWLRMWHHGNLRTNRETSWYLGLCFGQNQYVLTYCMLMGPESIRDRLSAMIWHHLHVIRSLVVSSGRTSVETTEFHEELTGLFAAMPNAVSLSRVSLAFTIFDAENKVAESGHFGPGRPHVIGVENVITPYNDVVINFSNGRDLRYWEVAADLATTHAYILSYDSSKINAAPADTVQRRVAGSMLNCSSVAECHKVLGSMVLEENLPRYYLAAIMNSESLIEMADSEPHYDKAE